MGICPLSGEPLDEDESEATAAAGLGEACASYLLQQQYNKPFKIVGIPDEYTVTGSQTEIFDHYGISKDGLTDTALSLLKKA